MSSSILDRARAVSARGLCLGLLCLALVGCDEPASDAGSTSDDAAQAASRASTLAHDAEHQHATYVCPMHPQIVASEPGTCPICGMDLVKKQAVPAVEAALAHADADHAPTYVCPMHPNIVQDHPGSCPICGMDLVEKRATLMPPAQETGSHAEVALSGAIAQSLGVRTVEVDRGALRREVRAVGRVAYDETKLAHVHPRAAGWIEGLALRAEGEPVKKGQPLAELYAPEILSAQVDFLIALERSGSGGAQVQPDKARNILRLLGVPEAVIRTIEKTRQTRNAIPVEAPADGIVTQMMAREGMYVTPSIEMFTIAALSEVWVLVDVFEHQLAWVAPGMSAEMQVPAYPGRTWTGKVDYLYPDLDPKSRTLRVRLVFSNQQLELKPNMFADVAIAGGPKRDVLKIPRDALIVTGERESVVKSLGGGRFQPVDVVTGMEADGEVEIRSGLAAGDEVVVSGQFLIDSESSLQASFRRMR